MNASTLSDQFGTNTYIMNLRLRYLRAMILNGPDRFDADAQAIIDDLLHVLTILHRRITDLEEQIDTKGARQ